MPPQWQADREVDFYREQFEFLMGELADLPTDRPLVVAGTDLLPELLTGLGVPAERAVWIVPTPGFQLEYYAAREFVTAHLAGCPDPELSFANWMRRDMIFADYVRRTAGERDGAVLTVDGSVPAEKTADVVAGHTSGWASLGRRPDGSQARMARCPSLAVRRESQEQTTWPIHVCELGFNRQNLACSDLHHSNFLNRSALHASASDLARPNSNKPCKHARF